GKSASRLWRNFRIKKLGKARIVCHIFEIRIVPCLKAVGTVQLDGIVEVTKAILRAVGQAVQQSQAVVREVRFGVLLENLFHVISRLVELSTIDEGDGVIIVFPQSFERRSPSRELLVTGIEMDAGTVGKLPAGTGEHLLQQTLRLIKLVLLHRLQPGFIVLHSLCIFWIGRRRSFTGGSLLHLNNVARLSSNWLFCLRFSSGILR